MNSMDEGNFLDYDIIYTKNVFHAKNVLMNTNDSEEDSTSK